MPLRPFLRLRRAAPAVGLVLLASCANPPQQPAVASSGVDLDTAARVIAEGLSAQLDQRAGASGTLRGMTSRLPEPVGALLGRAQPSRTTAIALDPFLDGTSGQRTAAAAELERRIVAAFARLRPDYAVARATSESVGRTDLLMVGSLTVERAGSPSPGARAEPGVARVAVVSRSQVVVAAQTEVRIVDARFDVTPQRLEQDSPVVTSDAAVRGLLDSAATPAGRPAEPTYLRQVGASAAIAQGSDAYDAGRYPEALRAFETALADPSGEQIRALNGAYLANVRLGRSAEAEQLFGRIVSLGLRDRRLAIKFLFNPGTTEFWSDPQVSGPYAMWLRQVARAMERSELCADVLGHASRTGTEAFNEKLSEQRADLIRRRLVGESGALAQRLTARGLGSREAIVGIGTDDARDAVDRRVGFAFRDCR